VRPSRATSGPSYFEGAVNTDAHYGIFTNVAGDQNITYAKDEPETLLALLNPVYRTGYYIPQCMKGTREDIFNRIDQRLESVDAPNILRIGGSPGAAKSVIASTLINRLKERSHPCSHFFFKRGDVELSSGIKSVDAKEAASLHIGTSRDVRTTCYATLTVTEHPQL
jgi:hypothetical protein